MEVRAHDVLTDPPVEADLHLLHRVDTEFENKQWRGILDRFADVRVLFAAAEILSPGVLLGELRGA